MKILVTGASGFIGGSFMRLCNKDFILQGTYFNNKKDSLQFLDVTDKQQVFNLFEKYVPEVVLHSAALPNVNLCETERELSYQKNFVGTQNVVDACRAYGTKIVFISTDYVFDGESGPYLEDAPTNPLNYYGRLKLSAEEYIQENLNNYLIVRTTNVYGWNKESKNFVMFIISKLEKNEPVSVAVDQYGNPTLVENLCEAVRELIIKNKKGTYNVAGPDTVNRLDFARKVVTVFGFDKRLISGMYTDNLEQAAKRPLKSGFVTDKIKKELITQMLNMEEGLNFMKKMRDEQQPFETDQKTYQTNKEKNQKIVIIGAGLSGLTNAFFLKEKCEVYEKENHAGGLISPIIKDGFVFDKGPHVIHGKSEEYLKFVECLLPGNGFLKNYSRPAQYSHGLVIPYPYSVNLYGLPPQVIKECLLGYIEAKFDPGKRLPVNYVEWCYYHFGRGFTEHFMIPYAKKYWAVDPTILTTEWVKQVIFLPELDQVIEGALRPLDKNYYYYYDFLYPKESSSQKIVDALVQNIPFINYNHACTKIDILRKTVTFNGNKTVPFVSLISTMPLPLLIELISNVPKEIKKAADKLLNNSCLVVFIGVDRVELTDKTWIYYDEPEVCFYRLSFPRNIAEYTVPEGKSSIIAEVAYSKYKKINKEVIVDQVVEDMLKVGIISREDKIIFKDFYDLNYSYAIYDKNRTKSVNLIKNFLKEHNITTCGRFGSWSYSWMHDVIEEVMKTAGNQYSTL